MPKKGISVRKRKNSTCAWVHGRYLLYETFPHGGRHAQRYFNISFPSSRRDNNTANQVLYMSDGLWKAILIDQCMTNDHGRRNYSRHGNYCGKFLRKTRVFYSNLDMKKYPRKAKNRQRSNILCISAEIY